MKNSKNKRTSILIIILLGLLILAYKVMFVEDTSDLTAEENIAASQRIEILLNQIESINFDTSVTNDAVFKSLKSIEIPALSLPVGRANPFSATLR